MQVHSLSLHEPADGLLGSFAAEQAPVRKDARVSAPPIELEPLLAAVRERSAFTESPKHGEVHWRTVGATGSGSPSRSGPATRA